MVMFLSDQMYLLVIDQEQANLTSSKRVLNELWDEYPLQPEKKSVLYSGIFIHRR